MSAAHNETPGPAREVQDLAYEVASKVVQEQQITSRTVFSPADSLRFDESLGDSIDPRALGDHNTLLRRRGVVREAVWYAAHIANNASLFEKAWAQDSQKIRKRMQGRGGSIALRYYS